MQVQPKVLRLDAVTKQLGVGRSTLYRWMDEGRFPRPIKLGGKAVGWLVSDIDCWIDQRVQARREVAHG